jgi:putative membrane protein
MGHAIKLATVLTLVLASAACMRHRNEVVYSPELDDAQIVTALIAFHQGEVDAARIAVTRSTDQNVQAFAVGMQTEHNAAIDRLQTFARNHELVPSGSELSVSIAHGAARTGDSLNAASHEHFDASYMGTQYNSHLKLIEILDDVVLPRISNEELRAEARSQHVSARAHFEHVQTVRAQVAATNELERERAVAVRP